MDYTRLSCKIPMLQSIENHMKANPEHLRASSFAITGLRVHIN